MNEIITSPEEALSLINQIENEEIVGDDRTKVMQRLKMFHESAQSDISNEGTQREKLNWATRFGRDLEKRKIMFEDIMEATTPGDDGVVEQGYPEAVLQTVGKVGAGAFFDFIGETLISGGRGLSVITPDLIEKPLLNAATSAGHAFLNTDAGKAGLKAAVEGIEKWNEYKEKNPRSARNIEAVVNIGMLAVPIKGKPKISVGNMAIHPSPIKGGTWLTEFGHAGEKMLERGLTSEMKRKTAYIDELILEKASQSVLEGRVSRTLEKGVGWTEGLWKEYTLSPFEKSMAKEVRKISGVSPKKTFQGNWRAIETAVWDESKKLTKLLNKHDVPVSPLDYRKVLVASRKELADNPLIVGDAAKTSERIINKAWDLASPAIQKNKLSASELLKVRKWLDDWIAKQKGEKVFGSKKGSIDPGLETAMSAAVKSVRNSINELVITKATDVGVKKSLTKQNLLLTAMDRVKAKAASEGNNVLLRLWRRFLPALTARGQATQSLALLSGVGGLGAASLFAPSITTVAGVGAAAYFGTRAVMSPKLKIHIGNILNGVDDLIKKALDPATVLELRADKALLLEFLKAAEEASLREKSGSP